MSDSQYQAMLVLFNAADEDFWLIPEATREQFFDKLYAQ